MGRGAVGLLAVASALRLASLGGYARVASGWGGLLAAATGLEVVVLGLAAVALARSWRGAEAAVLTLGALGAAELVVHGLEGVADLEVWTWLAVAAGGLAALAAAVVIARWQDTAAPPAGGGNRGVRGLGLAAGLVVAVSLATAQAFVAVPGAAGDGAEVVLATTFSVTRLPLSVAVIAVLAWSAGRARLEHLGGVAVVLAVEAVGGAARAATLWELGGAGWPAVGLTVAAVALGVLVPAAVVQVTSSSA